jgi:hypothetical protein
MECLELAYLSHPTREAGEWMVMDEKGKVLFSSPDVDAVQDYLDALLSECEF